MLRAIVTAILFLCWPLLANAEERITLFDTEAVIRADGTVNVREAISVNVEGRVIKHGIFRDFPTQYKDSHGRRMRVDLTVDNVQLDDQAVPYRVESIDGGSRIKIGDPDVYVSDGLHRYVISYSVTREIGFYDGFDEFYWNVTGNGWDFTIDKARIAVELPTSAEISQHAEYTGYAGATGRSARVTLLDGNRYVAETTVPLAPQEGLTIAIGWQKGVVAPPSGAQNAWWMLRDNAWAIAGIATPLAALLYYFYAWLRVGRDPQKGQIIPLFHPPAGIGAAEARYLTRQGFDNKTFAAALVGLATKGGLKIFDDDGERSIEKIGNSLAAPSASEAAAYAALPAKRLGLQQENYKAVQGLKSQIEAALSKQFDGTYFNRNAKWLLPGILVSLIGLGYAAWASPAQLGIPVVFAVVWLGIWWSATLSGLMGAIGKMVTGRGLAAKAGAFAKSLFLLPFLAIGVAVPMAAVYYGATSPEVLFIGGAALAVVFLNVVFFKLMPAATPAGQQVLDQIEGFKLYMTTAEEERLNMLNPPEKTPQLFERYLPYAIALDCENEWGAKFAAVLAAAAAAGAATAPVWYSGNRWSPESASSFSRDMGSSMASTLGSAGTSPGSSSGSGGGGSSGGGGGGGGGGGW